MTSYHFRINNLTIARDINNHSIISLSVIVHINCDNQFCESVVFYFNWEKTDALVSRNSCYSIRKIKKINHQINYIECLNLKPLGCSNLELARYRKIDPLDIKPRKT